MLSLSQMHTDHGRSFIIFCLEATANGSTNTHTLSRIKYIHANSARIKFASHYEIEFDIRSKREVISVSCFWVLWTTTSDLDHCQSNVVLIYTRPTSVKFRCVCDVIHSSLWLFVYFQICDSTSNLLLNINYIWPGERHKVFFSAALLPFLLRFSRAPSCNFQSKCKVTAQKSYQFLEHTTIVFRVALPPNEG